VRPRIGSGQLALFADAPPERSRAAPLTDLAEDRMLASELPPHVRFGTSSWTFPGWSGFFYPEGTSERELADHGLTFYANNPLFSTVGIDRSYYAPIDVMTWRRYARDLPPGFACVTKVWSEIVTPDDARTNQPNPRYLDRELFLTRVLEPIAGAFREHQGPIVFEFPPARHRLDPAAFVDRLGEFLLGLPRDFGYAVEIRNRELLTDEYLGMLRGQGVAHVLNFWERMPTVGDQLALPGILTADTVVCRLMIPPGQTYARRVADLRPFDRLVDPQPEMRSDVVRLVEECGRQGKVLFVIVNNKAEGSSPLTVRELARLVVRREQSK
jgi:uncharacterized protein YecE (DUF72 family)